MKVAMLQCQYIIEINRTIYKVTIDYYLLKIYKELNTYIINLNIISLNLQEFERYIIENYTKGQKI